MLEKVYITDYISGERVKAGPEEVEAVQIFSRRLVEEYGYDKSQIRTHPQFRIKESPSGREKYPVDIAVFRDENQIEDIGRCCRRDLYRPTNLKATSRDVRNHLAGMITGITRDETLAQQLINLLFCKLSGPSIRRTGQKRVRRRFRSDGHLDPGRRLVGIRGRRTLEFFDPRSRSGRDR